MIIHPPQPIVLQWTVAPPPIVFGTVGSTVIQQPRDSRSLSQVSSERTLHGTCSLNAHVGPSAPRPISPISDPSNVLIGPSLACSLQEIPDS